MNLKNLKIKPFTGVYKDFLDFKAINSNCYSETSIVTKKIIEDIIEEYIHKQEVIIKYFQGEMIVENKNYPLELITTDKRKRARIENSENLVYLKGVLKYSSVKEKLTFDSFEEIHITYGVDTWILDTSSLSFEEMMYELLTGINMDSSKLLLKEKHMFLLRLVPLVQPQFLLVDFSKRSTRKTRTYSDLGYYVPATYNFTRAKIIYDNSSKQKGLIFYSLYGALILDEFQKNQDDGITMGIQQYKNDGTISDDKGNVMPLNTSVIILGNPKKHINYPYIFTQWQNIFEGTTICKENSSTGDAFLSRVDCMIPSWGSRTINPEMLLDEKVKRIPPYILRSIFSQLREIDISDKVKAIITRFNLPVDKNDIRSQTAINNTFQGLIKLLLPQLIKSDDYKKFERELIYLYNLAVEARIIVNNMLHNIKPENSAFNFNFSTSCYFSLEKSTCILPHRKITIINKKVIKKALDYIGILQNQSEIDIMKKLKIEFEGNRDTLEHSLIMGNMLEKSFFEEVEYFFKTHRSAIINTTLGATLAVSTGLYLFKSKKIKMSKLKSLLPFIGISGVAPKKLQKWFIEMNKETQTKRSYTWSDDIFFNHLIGEHESTSYKKNIVKWLEENCFYNFKQK